MPEFEGQHTPRQGSEVSFASLSEIVPSAPAILDADPSDPAGWVPAGWELPIPMPRNQSEKAVAPAKSLTQRVGKLVSLRKAFGREVSPAPTGPAQQLPGAAKQLHVDTPERDLDRKKSQMGEMLVSVLNLAPRLADDGSQSASARLSRRFSQGLQGLDSLILNPHGRIRMLWDLSTLVLLLYLMASLPIFIGFDIPSDPVTDGIDWLITVFFLADIVINFRTGYVDDNGAVVSASRPIGAPRLRRTERIDERNFAKLP